MHEKCWALEEDRESNPLLHAFSKAEHAADEVTARVFRTVLDSLKHYRSFLEHEALCFLQHENGVELGERLHGRQTASTMLETIYAVRNLPSCCCAVVSLLLCHRLVVVAHRCNASRRADF